MANMELIIFILNALVLGGFGWLLYKQVKKLSSLVKENPSPKVIVSPNKIDEDSSNEIEFNEERPFTIPPDVKVEVEGGDTVTPPGYEEVKT